MLSPSQEVIVSCAFGRTLHWHGGMHWDRHRVLSRLCLSLPVLSLSTNVPMPQCLFIPYSTVQ